MSLAGGGLLKRTSLVPSEPSRVINAGMTRHAALANSLDLEPKPVAFLQAANNRRKVPGLRIAVRAQHAH